MGLPTDDVVACRGANNRSLRCGVVVLQLMPMQVLLLMKRGTTLPHGKRLSRRRATAALSNCWLRGDAARLACGSNNDDVWRVLQPLLEILNGMGNVQRRLASLPALWPLHVARVMRPGAIHCFGYALLNAGGLELAPLIAPLRGSGKQGQAACVAPTSKARRRIQAA